MFFIILLIIVLIGVLIWKAASDIKMEKDYNQLTADILSALGLKNWKYMSRVDGVVNLKSAKAVDNYDPIMYFKEDRDRLDKAIKVLANKQAYSDLLVQFLEDNDFKDRPMYARVEQDIRENLARLNSFDVVVSYQSPTGRSSNQKILNYKKAYLDNLKADPSQLMSKSEYNQMVKAKNKELVDEKHHAYYEQVNEIIDIANSNRDKLIIKGDQDELDKLISSLFDRTVNSIKKIKDLESEEWSIIGSFILNIRDEVNKILDRNKRIVEYYDSEDFKKIKATCDTIMDSQRDFNEYIEEKARSISALFGTRIVRNETEVEDEYNYIRPYKKSITPFTAEVSAAVFASAENSPLEYIVKYFYPAKDLYPDQIQKLQLLVEELETLKEAKQIIENYKKDYQQYLTDVPNFIMENDEDGFYSRLGFANISESVLTVAYKFSYTSGGGLTQRTFTVPMTEETIVQLITMLQSKLSFASFAKEQRALMTSKLRQHIKERDHFTCKFCGNSTDKEPNLLLEIDHIVPVAKGGCTVEDNLQTLCWKCNRQKSDKLI